MLTSFSLMILLGLLADTLFKKIKLPGLLGMLLLGVVLGPYGLNWLSRDLLHISEELRKLALIIILLRAGLGISKQDLKTAGFTAVKLSFLPGLIEGFTIAFFATLFLGFSFIEGSILGFIIAAVSPAVVVPMMLKLSEKHMGTNQGVPTLILAGASIDDVFAITLFTAFIGLYFGTNNNIFLQILGIPLSIALGIGLGLLFGLVLSFLFDRYTIRIPKIVLAVIGAAILLTAIESWLQNLVNIASLLGVMTLSYVLLQFYFHLKNRFFQITAVRPNQIKRFGHNTSHPSQPTFYLLLLPP
jgi:solute carrier family 9B (sodium/hydrogen exchanger), member 1/2